MNRSSKTSKAQASKPKAKASKAPATKQTASGTEYIPAEIGFTDNDEHNWLYFHTDPLAFIVPDDKSRYDVWQVDPAQGTLTRMMMATDCPLSSLDHYYSGDEVAFVTPHISAELAEHFLAVMYRMAECLKDYRDYHNGKEPPLREPVMHALKGGAA